MLFKGGLLYKILNVSVTGCRSITCIYLWGKTVLFWMLLLLMVWVQRTWGNKLSSKICVALLCVKDVPICIHSINLAFSVRLFTLREEHLSQKQMLQTLLAPQSTLSLEEGDIELPDDIELPFQTVAALEQLEIKLNEKFTQKVMVSVKQHYIFWKIPILWFCNIFSLSVYIYIYIYIYRGSIYYTLHMFTWIKSCARWYGQCSGYELVEYLELIIDHRFKS